MKAPRSNEAQEKLVAWYRDSNEVRQRRGIGNKPPISLINCVGITPTA